MSVAVIDYGMGNLDSVVRAVEECGGSPVLTRSGRDIAEATHIILPGVGAFAEGMERLHSLSLVKALEEQALGYGIPFLGICLGMQFLASRGTEGGDIPGLGWIEGEVKKLEPVNGERIPHVGWNDVEHDAQCELFRDIPSGKDFYFVHSYHFKCANPGDALASTPYCGGFVSAVARGNVFGVQFHPEKSQRAGFQLIRNFLAMR